MHITPIFISVFESNTEIEFCNLYAYIYTKTQNVTSPILPREISIVTFQLDVMSFVREKNQR